MNHHFRNITLLLILLIFQVPFVNAQYGPINPFVMPDNHSLNWYGSGDINNDNTIDGNDLTRLDSILSGQYTDPFTDGLVDRSDINGDQLLSHVDRELLKSYLDGTRHCLPGHWNFLQTKQERIDWLEKVIDIDRSEEGIASYDYPGDFYSDQLLINVHGFEDEMLGMFPSPPIDYQHNGRFNLPLTYASVYYNRPDLTLNRNLLAIMVGDNVFDWSDWCYIDPQWDQLILPEGFNEPAGDESFPELDNWLDDINNITNRDTIAPAVDLNYEDDSIALESGHFNLEYTLSDINLSGATYYFDDPLDKQIIFKDSMVLDLGNDRLNPVFDTTGMLELKLKNGQYSFGFEAHDHFFNSVSREFFLSINDPPPKITIVSPVADSSYLHYLPLFKYTIEDPDFSKAWYTIDSGQTKIDLQQEGDFFLYLDNGAYQLIMEAEDQFGNLSNDTIQFSINVKGPTLNPELVGDTVVFVYPNPVKDLLNILAPSNDTIIYVDIQDGSGRVLWMQDLDQLGSLSNRLIVDLSAHPKGIYFLKCYFNSGKRIMSKIIKL